MNERKEGQRRSESDVGYFRNDDYDKMNMNEMKMMRMIVIYMYMRIVF